jgi:[protein-PII] uridylyltransferase
MPWRADFEWGSTDGGVAHPPAGYVNDFVSAMPPRYGVLFDPRTIRKHAGAAYRRGTRLAHVEVWRTLADGSAALCVVAEDRPGLLSAIAAALISHRLDVITALVFSRALPLTYEQATEAVDLVWVRRASPTDTAAIGADEAVSIGEVLSAILSGAISVDQIAASSPLLPASAAAHDTRTVVRFDESEDPALASLHVETPDRPGVLLTIARELFAHGAQIVRSLVRTAEGRAFNQFELTEFNGGPLAPDRREQICAAVLTAVSVSVPETPAESGGVVVVPG